ncbi:MAG: histidine kinase [Chitinophagaceae bacterium]|nr:histidine kinase [Chitinophagaceae bacterium]
MPASVLSKNKLRVYFVSFWLIWSAIHAWVLHEWNYTLEEAWADSIVSNALLCMASMLIITSFRYYLPRKESFTYFGLMCIVLSAICISLTRFVLAFVIKDKTLDQYTQSIPVRAAIGILILGCVILINVLLHTLQEQQEQERRKSEADRIAKDAELYKLRQQLQPHFLFNSLNSINALVVSQPAGARKMIQQLSEYLRNTLKKEEHKWVTLEEELEYLQLYLDIEKVRFGHRLSTQIQADEIAMQMKLPVLLLQPVVENAIKFGLYDTTGDIVIGIDAKSSANMLTIKIENPFDAEVSKPVKGTGFGLSSVQKRLFLLFSRNDLLNTSTRENIFVTQVKIPQQ